MRVEAPTLEELFAEAARGLAELMAPGAAPGNRGEYETIVVQARDQDALLVDWLNELLYRAETRRTMATDFRIERLSRDELTASIGADVPLTDTPVKAATLHNLSIAKVPGGLTATVVFDV